jgi:chromosome segregation ATPase
MFDDKFDLVRNAGERLNDEQLQFQSFVDDTLDQMEAKRTGLEEREVLLQQARARVAENQIEMDRALEAIHGQEIKAGQRQRMTELSEALKRDQALIEQLDEQRYALRTDMDQAMEDLNAFADVLMMVDCLKSEFEQAQSELIEMQTIVATSGVNPDEHPLMGRLRESYENIERLTKVVERHRTQLASERVRSGVLS